VLADQAFGDQHENVFQRRLFFAEAADDNALLYELIKELG